jgi:hypothetical protein
MKHIYLLSEVTRVSLGSELTISCDIQLKIAI